MTKFILWSLSSVALATLLTTLPRLDNIPADASTSLPTSTSLLPAASLLPATSFLAVTPATHFGIAYVWVLAALLAETQEMVERGLARWYMAYACARIHVHIHVHAHTRARAHTHTYTHTHTRTYAHTHIRTYAHVYICAYAHMHICRYKDKLNILELPSLFGAFAALSLLLLGQHAAIAGWQRQDR